MSAGALAVAHRFSVKALGGGGDAACRTGDPHEIEP